MTSTQTISSVTHVPLPGTEWSFWRQVVLRAPGFPAAGLDALASGELASMADRLTETEADAAEDWARYREAFAVEAGRLSSHLLRLAADERLALALAWQNHRIFDTAIAPMRRNHADGNVKRNSKQRQHEELIASYWQRYCVKNDTIGFTGPVGWALLDPAADRTTLSAGDELVASSEVFFESWAIDQLAAVIAAEPGMAPMVPPRKLPFVRLDGHRAITPAGAPHELTPAELAVLRRSTGRVSARDIGRELAGLTPEVATPEDVYAVIARLRDKRLLAWKLELPLSPRPERHLRRFLRELADPELGADALGRLDLLEAAREAAGAAASRGDAAEFVSALHRLDEVFTQVAGAQPSRRSGQAYGGRTVVYHDARRDTALSLGADFLAALRPLSLLLDSARWLTYQFAVRIQELLTDVAAQMSAGGTRPDLASFWFQCMPAIYRRAPSIVSELQRDFQHRWAEILRIPPGTRSVRLTADSLEDRVRKAFAAPHSGWSDGRYVSPDLMIAATGMDAVERGDFEIVLGEMHLALPTSRHYCFVTQHPFPEDLLDCVTADSPEPRLLPVVPKETQGRLSVRTQSALTRDMDFLVSFAAQTAEAGRPRLFDAADLFVTTTAAGPVVSIPGQSPYPVIDVFREVLVHVFLDAFELLPQAPHRPRIAIDRLVIARESWRFDVRDIGFPQLSDEAARFAAGRRWRTTTGMPDRVFVKVPGENKPFFVDFRSAVSVNILAKSLRRLQAKATPAKGVWAQFSEMLPSADQLWLTDAVGRRYTSELRTVAVDQRKG